MIISLVSDDGILGDGIMAYAADKITVNGIQLGQLEKMDIVSEAGEHGELTLCGYLVEEQGVEILYGITEEESISRSRYISRSSTPRSPL